MPAVASVEFKGIGASTLESDFKKVGTAAGNSSKQISNAGSAMNTFKGGMKSAAQGVGAMASSFATLSLSVVNTWRAYRDLGDAQLAVDRANTKLTKSQEKLNDLKKKEQLLLSQGKRGGIEDQRRMINIAKLKKAASEAEKKYGKNSLEAADARLAVTEAERKGTETSGKLAEVRKDIAIQEEVVANNTFAANEAQERFNDTQQDFYLSILPTALSSIGSLTFAFNGLKGVLGGGPGGLLGLIGPLGLGIAGLSVAFLAYQNNWLGLKDVIDGVIGWIQERFGDWQKTIGEVFTLIQQGDWGGAFERIKKAAIDFWEDLKKSVPFFGGIAKLVDALAHGQWGVAFTMIKEAALKFWEDLKAAIPFFAGAETFFRQLFSGDIAGAWETLKTGIVAAWNWITSHVPLLGDLANYLRTKWELAQATATSLFGAMKAELTKAGGPFDQIQQGLAKIGSGDVTGGIGQLNAGITKGIETIGHTISEWVKTNFGINLEGARNALYDIGAKIVGYIANGLTFVSTTYIDQAIVSLFNVDNWIAALTASWDAIVKVGTAIFKFLMGSLFGATTDPKGAVDAVANLGKGIWAALLVWFETNLPDTTAILEAIGSAIGGAVERLPGRLFNVGVTIWNAIIEGIKMAIKPFDWSGQLQQILEQAKAKPVEFKVNLNADPKQAVNIAKDTKQAIDKTTATMTITAAPPGVKKRAAPPGLDAVLKKAQANVKGHAEGNFDAIVDKPYLFMAGEKGKERVRVTKPGQRGYNDAGGGNGTVIVGPIYLGEDIIMPRRAFKLNQRGASYK
jgi:hypothetical protein